MDGGMRLLSTYTYLMIVIPGAVLQLKLVNHAMEVYNQAEIGPIYSSSLILLHMLCGGIILNEKALYTRNELYVLIFYSLICILGIYIIAKKPAIWNDVVISAKNRQSDTNLSTSASTFEFYLKYEADLAHFEDSDKRKIADVLKVFESSHQNVANEMETLFDHESLLDARVRIQKITE